MKKRLIITLCAIVLAFFSFSSIATAQPLPGRTLQMGWTTDQFAPWTIWEDPVRFVNGGQMRGSTGVYGLVGGGAVYYRLPGSSQDNITVTFIDGEDASRCSEFEVERILSLDRGHINWLHPRKEDVTFIKNVYVFSEETLLSAGISGITQVIVTGHGQLVPQREGDPFIGVTTVPIDRVTIGLKRQSKKPKKDLLVAECQYDFEPEAGIELTVTRLF